MKISLITVTFNCANTLNDTLNSVRKQNCRNLEYIIIDGASTDGSVDIIKNNNDIISYWSSSADEGLYDAMNKGIRQATGDYIGFLHSDDMFFSDNTLNKIFNALESYTPDVLYGDLQYVNASDTSKVVRLWKSNAFHPGLLKMGWMPPHPTLYIKREVMVKTGFFNTSYKIAADYDYILRLFSKHAKNFYYHPHVIIKMRLGGESNKSIKNIIKKSKEDLRALKTNKAGGLLTLILKNLRKLPQFLNHRKSY
ncbi:MAG: glycosyltransferase [Chlorobi bacterium]|nr:glycosyltransferase [Chlorobiota bacterium]